MRKIGIVVMALLCMSFAVPALAAAPGEMSFGLGGGVAMPMGDFGDVAKMGFTGGVFGDYWITPAVALGVDGSYNSFGIADDYQSLLDALFPGETVDLTFTAMQFGAHAKYMFPMADAPMSPWIQAGVGYYSFKSKFDVAGASDETTDNKIGINGALGVNFKTTPTFSVGAMGSFHHVLTEEQATQYFTLGLTLNFSTAASTK